MPPKFLLIGQGVDINNPPFGVSSRYIEIRSKAPALQKQNRKMEVQQNDIANAQGGSLAFSSDVEKRYAELGVMRNVEL